MSYTHAHIIQMYTAGQRVISTQAVRRRPGLAAGLGICPLICQAYLGRFDNFAAPAKQSGPIDWK